MDHVPLPDNYYTEDLWHDSPLSDDEREALRDEVRQLILGIKEETYIKVENTAIGAIDFTRFRDEPSLSLSVYLTPDKLETQPVGDENFSEEVDESVADEPHYLRDLGHEWAALEYDVISELVLMLDLPEMPIELSDYLLGGDEHGPCLFCTSTSPEQACFSVTAHIPETTQRIYDDAEFQLARKLNIPIDGSDK